MKQDVLRFRPRKIVSGGQTGVDRGALDAAMRLGIQTGGWCPRDRLAEDGRIPDQYLVSELNDVRYERRTEQNVLDSDATLILSRQSLSGGTLLTKEMARKHGRPFLIVNPDVSGDERRASDWLEQIRPSILNVAGPRESKDAGIQHATDVWITRLFSANI